MKTFSILLLTVMIAIFAEKYMAKYLLVEIDQPEGEVNPNENNGSGSISARATCSAKSVKYATAILEACPGYKVLTKYSNPFVAKDNCCELTTHDSECGKSFFVNPVIGKCVCEKKGHDCIRTPGLHTEYRFEDESDVDECEAGTDECDANADCTNTVGGFTCVCKPGFAGDGRNCTDVDECEVGKNNCDANADCTNTAGSFTCACRLGFSGNGKNCTAQTPLECCRKNGVSGWCLGMCAPKDAMARQVNACSPYKKIIYQCINNTH